ncbi:MAG: hypothetical protein ACXWQO_01400 [Bdellovibrionota bacterium]
MKLLWLFLLSGPALASGSLELSGVVHPALEIGIQTFNDGYSIRNLGNSMALFQIGDRDKSGHKVAWLRQNEQVLLRTDYTQKTGESIEIRILAP